MCGNSVHQDRRFLYQYMPELAHFFIIVTFRRQCAKGREPVLEYHAQIRKKRILIAPWTISMSLSRTKSIITSIC